MSQFGKWWNDPKKHCKRLNHWLPYWKSFATEVAAHRPVRYFTLCARSMIDVFMMIKEGLLSIDADNYSIGSVRFCECDQEHFAEIKDMIAIEDAGFFGRLEDVVLFRETNFTKQFPTLDSIATALEDERLAEDNVNQLQMKRTSFNFQASFPYDLINLDFCEYYYPEPPDMLRINQTVERILEWQKRPIDHEDSGIDSFVMAVTCRHDANFPAAAEARLTALIKDNCASSTDYRDTLIRSRKVATVEEWVTKDREDVFFAGWPKDIARAARERGWSMAILDYVYYRRVGDHDENPYVIACLVAKFTQANPHSAYMPAALYALVEENRKLIDKIERTSRAGRKIYQSLAEIVTLRNEQAKRMQRAELPEP